MRFIVALVVSFAPCLGLCETLEAPRPVLCRRCGSSWSLYLGRVRRRARRGLVLLQPLMQRCALAFLLFTVVMFVGVLGGEPAAHPPHAHPPAAVHPRLHLRLRAHRLLRRLLPAAPGERLLRQLAFSLGLAALITALMAVLWVTSAKQVKHAMTAVN